MSATYGFTGLDGAAVESDDIGFRLAMIPEPSTGPLVIAGLLGLAGQRRRVSKVVGSADRRGMLGSLWVPHEEPCGEGLVGGEASLPRRRRLRSLGGTVKDRTLSEGTARLVASPSLQLAQ
jgi:hypothetical protein